MVDVKYDIGESEIHGQGAIANSVIAKAVLVGIVVERKNKKLVVTDYLGKFVNHSVSANSELFMVGDNFYLKTTKEVAQGDELLVNYDEAPWFIANS